MKLIWRTVKIIHRIPMGSATLFTLITIHLCLWNLCNGGIIKREIDEILKAQNRTNINLKQINAKTVAQLNHSNINLTETYGKNTLKLNPIKIETEDNSGITTTNLPDDNEENETERHFDLSNYTPSYNLNVSSEKTDSDVVPEYATPVTEDYEKLFENIKLTTPASFIDDIGLNHDKLTLETTTISKEFGLEESTEVNLAAIVENSEIVKNNSLFLNNTKIDHFTYNENTNDVHNTTENESPQPIGGNKKGKLLEYDNQIAIENIPTGSEVWALASMKDVERKSSDSGIGYNLTSKSELKGNGTASDHVTKLLTDWSAITKSGEFNNDSVLINTVQNDLTSKEELGSENKIITVRVTTPEPVTAASINISNNLSTENKLQLDEVYDSATEKMKTTVDEDPVITTLDDVANTPLEFNISSDDNLIGRENQNETKLLSVTTNSNDFTTTLVFDTTIKPDELLISTTDAITTMNDQQTSLSSNVVEMRKSTTTFVVTDIPTTEIIDDSTVLNTEEPPTYIQDKKTDNIKILNTTNIPKFKPIDDNTISHAIKPIDNNSIELSTVQTPNYSISESSVLDHKDTAPEFSYTVETSTADQLNESILVKDEKIGKSNNATIYFITSNNPNDVGGISTPPKETDWNAIIAIVVSIIGIIALILLLGFLYIIRRRQKQISYGQRCRPVGLDAYSLDNISIYNSVRRKGALRASKRSYGNAAFDDPTLKPNLLNVSVLPNFVENRNAIYDEFENLPEITAKPDEVPPGCENKNRYANVIPLPETRVNLKRIENDEKSEYINANYVKGPKDQTHYYIATQAPLDSTVTDFWRMVWEQSSQVILMLTDLNENGREVCAEYLPPSVVLDNNMNFGDFVITLKSREVKEKYALSIINLKNNMTNTWREITHFWYKWPETGVPSDETSVIAMLLEARSALKMPMTEQSEDGEHLNNGYTPSIENGAAYKKRIQGPLIVHCSNGTGRTGTVIACDIAIRMLELPTRSVDVPQIVYNVRRGRANAVLTKDQYDYIYKVANMYGQKLTGSTTNFNTNGKS